MRYTKAYIKISKIVRSILVFSLVLSAAACGAVPVTQQGDLDIAQYTLPPVVQSPVPIQGGELKFPIPEIKPSDSNSLNPLKVKNVELYNMFSLIYEQPVRIDVDGTAEPELARTWEVDSTGKVWTFHLREGVNWQDGSGEFTAHDVVYTIEKIKSYSKDDSTYAQNKDILKDYTAIDNYTVEITLSEPGNAAIYFMTFPVLCKSYCTGKDLDTLTPMGTGPYKVESYETDIKMTLKPNELWWRQTPYIEKLTAVCYENHSLELSAFDQDLLDFMTTSSISVNIYRKRGIKESSDYLTRYYACLVPNTKSGLFSDVNMRRAISYALDKRDIVSQALLGHAVAADYPVAPDSYLSEGSANTYEYNTQKAASLFAQAGWKDRNGDGTLERVEGTEIIDLTIALLLPLNREDTYRRDVADNIVYQLKQCGINVEIQEQDYNAYVQSLKAGNFELALCEFYLYQDPDVSFMIGSAGDRNYGGFSDTEMDAALANCKSALNEDEMKAAYIAMENKFMDSVPQISLYFRTNALLYDAMINIKGSMRETDVYTAIPQWYLYIKGSNTENG